MQKFLNLFFGETDLYNSASANILKGQVFLSLPFFIGNWAGVVLNL